MRGSIIDGAIAATTSPSVRRSVKVYFSISETKTNRYTHAHAHASICNKTDIRLLLYYCRVRFISAVLRQRTPQRISYYYFFSGPSAVAPSSITHILLFISHRRSTIIKINRSRSRVVFCATPGVLKRLPVPFSNVYYTCAYDTECSASTMRAHCSVCVSHRKRNPYRSLSNALYAPCIRRDGRGLTRIV